MGPGAQRQTSCLAVFRAWLNTWALPNSRRAFPYLADAVGPLRSGLVGTGSLSLRARQGANDHIKRLFLLALYLSCNCLVPYLLDCFMRGRGGGGWGGGGGPGGGRAAYRYLFGIELHSVSNAATRECVSMVVFSDDPPARRAFYMQAEF